MKMGAASKWLDLEKGMEENHEDLWEECMKRQRGRAGWGRLDLTVGNRESSIRVAAGENLKNVKATAGASKPKIPKRQKESWEHCPAWVSGEKTIRKRKTEKGCPPYWP